MEATRDIVEVQLPRLADLREKGTISPRSIDVFFEKGVFDRVQTKIILEVARAWFLSYLKLTSSRLAKNWV